MKVIRFIVALVACCVLLPCLAVAEQLAAVNVEGTQRVQVDTVLLQTTSRAGQRFNADTVASDIKEIYRTGFFEQVTAALRRTQRGTVLVFQVIEKPALRNVFVRGNEEVKDETLKEKLNISARRFLDRQKLDAGIREVKQHYQSEGYFDAEVDFVATPVGDNQVDVTFRITEGEKKLLRRVNFEGNRSVDSDELEDAIETKRYRWWSSWISGGGVIKEEQLKNDVRVLSRLYLNRGYADIRVAEPVIEHIDDGVTVTFKINEGEVYTFTSIDVEGDLIEESPEKTLEGITTKVGDVFNVDTLREDTFAISDKFTDIGYAFANVSPDTNLDRATKTVALTFQVSQGELITVDRIRVSGNKKTRDNVIRRTLKIHERETFSSSKIRRSQELLSRLGFFDEVTITPQSTDRANEVDLAIGVREGTTGTFSAGAGVSSGDGVLFNTRISENNLFGYGVSLTLDVDLGSRNENFVISYDDPRLDDTRWSLGFDILSVEREFDDFDREQRGGSVTVGYPLVFLGPEYLDDIRFSLKYEFLRVRIDEVEPDAPVLIQNEEGKSTSSSITPRLVRNTIDNPLNPTRGSRQVVSFEVAGLGGNEDFWLGQVSNTWYYPLVDTGWGPIVFSNRVRFGYGDTFDSEPMPLFKRFFPGGINSVRGFDSRELGPKDEAGNEFGGSKQLIANAEVIFPFFPAIGLKGVVFYDIGNAFDDGESLDFGDLREAVGWGFRWNSPLGPIRIELGYPLDKEPGEDSVVTNFSFGAPL